MESLVRSHVGGLPEAPNVAPISTRARNTDEASTPGGYSPTAGPAGAFAPNRRFARLAAFAALSPAPGAGSAPSDSQGSDGVSGLSSVRNTSCIANESSHRFGEKASVAS